MSVLIKGMKMPNMCSECDFVGSSIMHNGKYICECPSVKSCGKYVTEAARKSIRDLACPLVEVQEPHGRLIDGDALWDAMSKYHDNEGAKKEEIGYSKAWLHHKGHNPHHWEYWTDFGNNGEIIANKIPSKYVIEMVCDWIGAGKVYSKKAWSQSEPLNYYKKVRAGRYFHPETEKLLVKLLEIIRDDGLEAFHSICCKRYPLFTDYDGLYIP